MGQFIGGVISGLTASFICWLVREIYQYFRYYRNSKYSGKWLNEIFDDNGNVIKRDEATIKHNKRTNYITGTVKRVHPSIQNKNWMCSGIITDSHIIVSFWPKELIKSDGCVYATFASDYIYEGYYLKETDSDIKKVKIRLTKINTK